MVREQLEALLKRVVAAEDLCLCDLCARSVAVPTVYLPTQIHLCTKQRRQISVTNARSVTPLAGRVPWPAPRRAAEHPRRTAGDEYLEW